MGAEKGNNIIKGLLAYYTTANFETSKGLDTHSNTSRITNYFEKNFGLKKPYNGKTESKLNQNSTIYPATHFCTPSNENINYSIHHFNGSWLDGYARRNKLSFFGKYIIARFRKNLQISSNILPLYNNEKMIASFKLSDKIIFGLIKCGA